MKQTSNSPSKSWRVLTAVGVSKSAIEYTKSHKKGFPVVLVSNKLKKLLSNTMQMVLETMKFFGLSIWRIPLRLTDELKLISLYCFTKEDRNAFYHELKNNRWVNPPTFDTLYYSSTGRTQYWKNDTFLCTCWLSFIFILWNETYFRKNLQVHTEHPHF